VLIEPRPRAAARFILVSLGLFTFTDLDGPFLAACFQSLLEVVASEVSVVKVLEPLLVMGRVLELGLVVETNESTEVQLNTGNALDLNE
jgi:hypothetical protein